MTEFLNITNRLLQKRGTTLYSLKKVVPTSFSLTNPTQAPTVTETIYSLLSYPSRYKKNQMYNELIKIGDIKLYVDPTGLVDMSGNNVIPTKSDKIATTIEEWDIINVEQFLDQDIVSLYILQIRN